MKQVLDIERTITPVSTTRETYLYRKSLIETSKKSVFEAL
jgi:hypothetical protein